MTVKMRYDQDDDVLMIWFAEGKRVDHAERMGQSILHLTEHDEPILLEILNARRFIVDLVSTAITPAEAATP
ncbi:MAG: DUF2283 domain-containing protein [Anaerolineae bacterium]|nr:DUF2283 domain-containing protein [Anaerolineae bacterium]